jgi:DNA invertase Pin-like site-specific DNA recombinase
VSQTNGREGESFASPGEQRDRIATFCEREGIELVHVHEELDVSGGKSLEDRPGLSAAVRSVEAGEADVIAAAYFDRLFRSIATQAEVIERVEAAGGSVVAVDVGQVTNGSAGQWLSGAMLGTVSEYLRRSVGERTAEAQRRAIARGVAPWGSVTPGYRRAEDRRFEPDPVTVPIVQEAFGMRAGGATIAVVRTFLAGAGIKLSYRGVQTLLSSRVVLGEIHFGPNYEPNLAAHPAIVDRDLWAKVQRTTVSRGRRGSSDRLLARLGVLRCATCGGRMVVGMHRQNGRAYPFYRCGHVRADCTQRVAISAELVEGQVIDAVRKALSDVTGRASAAAGVREAEATLERAQEALDSAIKAFAALGDEPAAADRLVELREARDAARIDLEQLGPDGGATLTLNAAADWDRLTLDEQRALIRVAVRQVIVAPGRGADRVTIEFVGE